MKVILLRDVAKMGKKGEVVEVPDGYALNQLIPKKWADAATVANLKKVASIQASHTEREKHSTDDFAATLAALQAEPLSIKVEQVNEQGHLFKAIRETDIIEVAKARGLVLGTSQLVLSAPIKAIGSHEVTFKHGNVNKQGVVLVIKASK